MRFSNLRIETVFNCKLRIETVFNSVIGLCNNEFYIYNIHTFVMFSQKGPCYDEDATHQSSLPQTNEAQEVCGLTYLCVINLLPSELLSHQACCCMLQIVE